MTTANTLKSQFGASIRIKETADLLRVNTASIKGDFEHFCNHWGIKYNRITKNGYTVYKN